MDFELTDQQELLRHTVRSWSEREMAPLMAAAELDGRFPVSLYPRLGELNLLCSSIPAEFGGAGLDLISECILTEELGRISSAFTASVMVHSGVATSAICRHGGLTLKRRLLPGAVRGRMIAAFALTEADAGSDAAAIRTRAVARDGEYTLHGNKSFITNGSIADFVTVAAVTDATARRGHGISLFVVERNTPGFRVGQRYDKAGNRAADTVELIFEHCTVPAENLIGQVNEGFGYLIESLTSGRVLHAARSLGVARAAFEKALAYAKQREAFGKKIGSFQAIAFRLSTMSCQIDASQWLTYHAAWLIDRGLPCTRQAATAKLVASQTAEHVTGSAMHILGGAGYMREGEVERLWRDAKLFPITEGSTEIQQMIIARELGLDI